jgi:signal transduction histidine kinase
MENEMVGSASNLSAADLAELMAAFNDVTAKLQASHDHLRAEVARLTNELHEANQAVARAQRLAALGEMAAGIAHEIRNPLAGIRLYARMLEDDIQGNSGQAGLAGKITASARAVEQIVHDVLAFAKELRVRPEPMLAEDAMERALEAVLGADAGAGARVGVERSVATGLTLEADAQLLHQVLVNILQNAVQAMSEAGGAGAEGGGTRRLLVTVCERRIALLPSSKTRTRCVLFRVQDDGPGVSPEVVERMFNPFFTTRASGTGLGLAIVHRIVDAHSGRIAVRNNRDLPSAERIGGQAPAGTADSSCLRGACVDVVLPARAIAKHAAPAPVPGQIGHEAGGAIHPGLVQVVQPSTRSQAASPTGRAGQDAWPPTQGAQA